jgi:hypothetical protein
MDIHYSSSFSNAGAAGDSYHVCGHDVMNIHIHPPRGYLTCHRQIIVYRLTHTHDYSLHAGAFKSDYITQTLYETTKPEQYGILEPF